ncbi:MAG: type II toxin-antitoxin system RelE/ParE family toxin [Dehalococcoidales bacterium]|nr:type II toxin-antitoxin system RelE/ParE family toxin [Dehalococcoidales bacterium]
MYKVILTRRAYREYDKLSPVDQNRIDATLDRLKINPRSPGIKKIRGNIYRIRVGDWRIIYAVFDKDRLVLVGKIVRRSEDTYNRVKDLL